MILFDMAKEKKSLQERFWSKVDKRGEDECWEWTAYKSPFGYGSLTIGKGYTEWAHRLSYKLNVGEIPDGMYICHLCNNPACVNPKHLRADTPSANSKYTWNSGHGVNQFIGKSWRRVFPHHGKSKRGPVEDRFWKNVDRKEYDECWNWLGHFKTGGYGSICDDRARGNKTIRAHRLSYRIHFGEIPDGLWVLHKCDNKKCVNPHHLFVGTRQDNVDDMCAKGRNYRVSGEDSACAKLTRESVREIRKLYSSGNHTYFSLSALFGVAWQTIGHIVRFRTWRE